MHKHTFDLERGRTSVCNHQEVLCDHFEVVEDVDLLPEGASTLGYANVTVSPSLYIIGDKF